MQNALVALNREFTAEGFEPLEMGIGINTGPVIVGNLGSEVRMKFGIVGPPVNTTARIESNTVGGQVLIGEATYEMVKSVVSAEQPQTIMMKGMKKPLVVYPIVGIGAPFHIDLNVASANGRGLLLNLSFRCWTLDGKRISEPELSGETIMINDQVITAIVQPPLEPLIDVRLVFDFCERAHCFQDIYAKVLSVGEARDHGAVNQLKITSISPGDRRILKKWAAAAAG
jgi:hypothetical protein